MFGDTDDVIAERLKLLNRQMAALTGVGGDGDVTNVDVEKSTSVQSSPEVNRTRNVTYNRDVNVTKNIDLAEPTEENTGRYFSTGAKPLTLSSTDEWKRLPLGFLAQTVNVRASDAVDVAFRSPHNDTQNVIRLRNKDLPFAAGGDNGLNTAFVWVRKSPQASSDPDVRVFAYA